MEVWKWKFWKTEVWLSRTLAVPLIQLNWHKFESPHLLTAHRHKNCARIFGYKLTKNPTNFPDRLLAEIDKFFSSPQDKLDFYKKAATQKPLAAPHLCSIQTAPTACSHTASAQEFWDWNLSNRGCKLPTAWISSRWDFSERVFLSTQLTLDINGVLVHLNVP